MSELSKRLPDDNEKLQPMIGEISWSKNLEHEFYLAYRDLSKVQPLVAQIGWTHNLITKVATLEVTAMNNFQELVA
jgi:hypothetical protein